MEAERLFGVQLDESALQRLEAHAALIRKWSEQVNLVSWRTEEELLFRHFLDSLAPLRLLETGDVSVADVGSGAGLPGLPLATVRPELRMVLVESRRRRASFLRHVVRSVGLGNARVDEGRAEELGQRLQRSFDAVVGRAVRPGIVAEFAALALRDGGSLILMEKTAERSAAPAGFSSGRECTYELPGGETHVVRELVVSRETSGRGGGVLDDRPKRRG